MKDPLQPIKEKDSILFSAIMNSRKAAFREGGIPEKYKILIALAIDAAEGAVEGVHSLAQQAGAVGATKEEIMETLSIVHYICGAGKMYAAARALEGLEL